MAFQPIVLLNTLGKLIEKMIARQLQFNAVKHSVLHPNQLGSIAQKLLRLTSFHTGIYHDAITQTTSLFHITSYI